LNDFQKLAPADSMQVLLECLSVDEAAGDPSVLAGACPPVWRSVVEIAERHRIVPLLYEQLSARRQVEGLPPEIAQDLQRQSRSAILDNLAILANAGLLLKDLSRVGIAVLPLKGILLAGKVYPKLGIRGMGDVDLLIPRTQLSEAVEWLRANGFVPRYPFTIEQECLTMHHLPPLYGPRGMVLELHWTLVPPSAPFSIDVESIWQKAGAGDLLGASCRIMSAEDLLLHLCLHATYLEYLSSGLRPFCDLAWVLKAYRETIDWSGLVETSTRWGVRRSAWLALNLAERLLRAPVPEGVIRGLMTADTEPEMIDWTAQQLLNPSSSGGKLAAVFAPNAPRQRVWLFSTQIFPPPHEMRPAYPDLARSALWPLAYLKHLGVVLRRNWRSAWSLLTGDAQARADAEQRQRINRLVEWQEAGQ
jgi:hypothetical protein